MGKFITTQYNDKVSSITDNIKSKIQNPYYRWNNLPDTIVTYYKLNKLMSQLDESAEFSWDAQGPYTGLVYDRITKFHMYGLDKIQMNIDLTEFGPTSSDIIGSCVILPNTIEPCPGDFFTIDYLDKKYLYRINDVQANTLPNGTNSFMVDYMLYYTSNDAIERYNIENKYTFIIENIGTNMDILIPEENYSILEDIDGAIDFVRSLLTSVYYNPRIQSLSFLQMSDIYYDPVVVEFLQNTKILQGEYGSIYIQHLIDPGSLFPVTYERSFFSALIEKDSTKMRRCITTCLCDQIDKRLGIFSFRPEVCYQVTHQSNPDQASFKSISLFEEGFIDNLLSKTLYTDETSNYYQMYNIIIKYFNDVDLSDSDLDSIKLIDCNDIDEKAYYSIIAALYCLEQEAVKLLSKKTVI